MDTPISRRHLLKVMGLTTVGLGIPGYTRFVKPYFQPKTLRSHAPFIDSRGQDIGPINRHISLSGERPTGHDFSRVHRIFSGYYDSYCANLDSLDTATLEELPLVIVGGGISGLSTASLLSHHRPVIFESQSRFGGVSQGEAWRDLEYPIGATYFAWPESNTELGRFYRELELESDIILRKEGDPVASDGRLYRSFWNGDTAPAYREQFQKLKQHFLDIVRSENGSFYPDLPTRDQNLINKMATFDDLTFFEYIQNFFERNGLGSHIHPHIQTVLQHYCWSALGGSFSEVSALAGLNFYASEFSDIALLPGGNAAVAEALMNRIRQKNPLGMNAFRAESVVFDVRIKGDHVLVSYEDSNGALKTIRAQSVVMSCPKYACKHLFRNGTLADRQALIHDTSYSSYAMTNILVDKRATGQFYDLFLIGQIDVDDIKYKGHLPPFLTHFENEAMAHGATDVIVGSYSRSDVNYDVLTLCQAFPETKSTDGTWGASTRSLYARGSTVFIDKLKSQFENEIAPLIGIQMGDVRAIRPTLWGHVLPVPKPGFLTSHIPERLSRPIDDRIFFVEQDNWQLPSIETAISEALAWAPRIDQSLR